MFRRLIYTLQRFMYGRNGFDRIVKYLLGFYLCLYLIANIVLKFAPYWSVYIIFQALLTATSLYAFFRILSKNVYKRRAECESFDRFLQKFGIGKPKIRFYGDYGQNGYGYNGYTQPVYETPKPKKPKYKNTKDTIYKKCKNCGAVLKLPRRRGKHVAVCPKCKQDVKVFSIR